jgi:surface polysaccharide O-acyltransferase-like enzyme
MRERLTEFDLLRILAALCVIAIHVTARYDLQQSELAYVLNQATRNAVPFFVIMSGFLLYYLDRQRWLGSGAFFRKRFGRVLWPYLLWTLIYYLLSNHYLGVAWSGWQNWLLQLGQHLLHGTGFFHLYFLVIIFQLYLLYPLLRIWVKKQAAFALVISLLLSLAGQTAVYLQEMQLITLPPLNGFLYCTLFPLWLFYFVLGMYLAEKRAGFEAWLQKKAVLLGLLTLAALVLLLLESRYTQTWELTIKPSILLYTLSSYCFFYALALRLREHIPVSRAQRLEWLSGQSFLIFLLHPLILSILFLFTPAGWTPWAGDPGMVLLFIAVSLTSLAATWLVSRTPLASLLGGLPTRR